MTPYRSVGLPLALAALCACSSSPPHPQGWTQSSSGVWMTTSGAGAERYSLSSAPTQGALPDLASSQAVDTVERYPGAKLLHSVPFQPCPAEAGLATYSLPGGKTLEVAFSVNDGQAVVAQYQRPASVGDAPEAMSALQQAVCYVP